MTPPPTQHDTPLAGVLVAFTLCLLLAGGLLAGAWHLLGRVVEWLIWTA